MNIISKLLMIMLRNTNACTHMKWKRNRKLDIFIQSYLTISYDRIKNQRATKDQMASMIKEKKKIEERRLC